MWSTVGKKPAAFYRQTTVSCREAVFNSHELDRSKFVHAMWRRHSIIIISFLQAASLSVSFPSVRVGTPRHGPRHNKCDLIILHCIIKIITVALVDGVHGKNGWRPPGKKTSWLNFSWVHIIFESNLSAIKETTENKWSLCQWDKTLIKARTIATKTE